MAKTAIRSPAQAALARFEQAVSRLASVALIAVSPGYEGLGIWTVLDGDPDGTDRDTVYGLQMDTLRKHPGASLYFRVLDASEFPERPLATMVPEDARFVYVRPDLQAQMPPTTVNA